MAAGRRFPARFPAARATANIVSDSGASESPASKALYSSTICRKIGSTIIVPPSAICWSICPEIPDWNSFDRNRVGSSSVGLCWRCRRRSQATRAAMAAAPTAMVAMTHSPPSCQMRMPSTMPPMPTTDNTAPTGSTVRGPVKGTSFTSRMPDSTTPMTTTSRRNAIRHDRNVVMKPPSNGPTAAAMAAAAPTSAYTLVWAAPWKLPWISDCIDGSSSDAPRPPTMDQKITMVARFWATVMATAPTA